MKHMILRECCAFLMLCMLLVFCAAALAEEDAITVTDEAYIEVADVDEIGEEAEEQEFESAEDAFSEDEETISATEDTFSEDEESLSDAEDAFWEDEESFFAIDAAAYVIDEIEDVDKVDGEETIVADSPAMEKVEGTEKDYCKAGQHVYPEGSDTCSICGFWKVSINDDSIEITGLNSQTYTGSEIRPIIVTQTVGENTVTLIENTDYTIVYENNVKAGTASATIIGIGDYVKERDPVHFTIFPKDISQLTVESVSDQEWTGNPIEPDVTIKDGDYTLIKGTDYTLSYSDEHTQAGSDVTITIIGKGNYTGSINRYFSTTRKSISDAKIVDIADQTYDGSAKTPPINVMDGNKTLVHGTDYTVEYTNNINAGQAAVTVKGVGNYTGTATKNFNIVAAPAGTATVTVPDQNLVYNGSNQEPGVTVTLNGKTLIAGTDYDVAYANNKNAGTATATVTFKGNYSGTASQTFTIKKKPITVSYSGSLDKVYDKTRNLRNVSASAFKFSGVVSGEKIQVLGIEGHYDSADVGTYSNIGLTVKIVYTDKDKTTPAVNLNYELSPNTCTASGKITPKTLTLKPGVAKSSTDSTLVPQTKVYGTADPSLRAKVGGLMSGDASSSAIGGKLTRESGENVGKYKIQIGTVKGKGNYAEAVTLEEGYFEITAKSVNATDVGMVSIGNQKYTGSAIEPTITLKYAKKVGGKTETETLVKGKDFDVVYSNNVEPGTATVTITGKGNYNGTRTATFHILKVNTATGTSSSSSSSSSGTSTNTTTIIYVYVTNPTPAPAAPAGPSIPAVKKAGSTTITAAPGAVYPLNLGGASGKAFKSSKKKVAVVDGNGNVTIRGAGKTKITFKVGKKKRTLTLTVKDPTIPASVALNPVNTAVKVGESVALTPVIPDGTTSGFKWKSSNKKVARVSNGVVTFKKPGKVTITATATRGKKKARVTFRVSK